MVIESKEEVYGWFKDLSGGDRIEFLSSLLHSCIPLECRFLASLIESLARRDHSVLLSDEHAANCADSMEALLSHDLLRSHNDGLANGVIDGRPQVAEVTSQKAVEGADHAEQAGDAVASQPDYGLTVRDRVIVSLCLLKSTNRVCATIVFKALQKQFSVKSLREHLDITAPRKVRDEIMLLLTLAVYHPALSYEQQNLLNHQLKTVKEYLSSLYYFTHQYPSMPFTAVQFQPSFFPITEPVPEPKEKSCYNCGSAGHLGQECRAETLDDLTRSSDFNLNFAPQPVPLIPPEQEPRNGPPAYTNHLKGRPAHPVHDPPARSFVSRDETDCRGKSIHPSSQRENFHDRTVNQGDPSGS